MSFFVSLSSFGVVLRFCMSRRSDFFAVVGRDRVVVGLLFLRGRSTAGHDILEFVVEVFCCRAVSSRVGGGRVEGCRRVGIGRVGA